MSSAFSHLADLALSWMNVDVRPAVKIALIVLGGAVIRFITHRVIDRVAERIATGRAGLSRLDARLATATALLSNSLLASERREQRARTTGSVLKSLTTAVVAGVVSMTVLQVLEVPIASLLASVGIVGIAVGLGAQALVKDVIAGIFMISEDQYGVGDVVDLGEAVGIVEAIGIRVTRLRDDDGTVWYLRNGEVLRVGNRSQGWARAVLDIEVVHRKDLAAVRVLLLEVATGLRTEDAFAALVLEDPQVWGVESVTAGGAVVRLVVKTQPLQQWSVARELRTRIMKRCEDDGLEVIQPGAVSK